MNQLNNMHKQIYLIHQKQMNNQLHIIKIGKIYVNKQNKNYLNYHKKNLYINN